MFRTHRAYYQRILTLLVAFSLLLILPYTILISRITRKQIEETVHNSNLQHMAHISETFSFDRKTISSLCLSTYFENGIKEIMYQQEVDDLVAIARLRDKLHSAAVLNSSIYSLAIYNSSTDTLYSTISDVAGDNSLEFFRSLENPTELTPYFRKIPIPNTNRHLDVFTYYVFDYPAERNPSLLVINQSASWLLKNAEKAVPQQSGSADFFIISADEGISSSNSSLEQSFLEELRNSFLSAYTQNTDGSGAFNLTIQDTKYVVAFWSLGRDTDCIVMLQKYDDLYSGLATLRKNLSLILGVCCILMIAAVIYISRKLYEPVASLTDYINQSAHSAYVSQNLNEFEQFKEIYSQNTSISASQNRRKVDHFIKIQLERILLDSTDASGKMFRELFPSHWINTISDVCYYCICIGLDSSNKFASRDEELLNVFAINNIVSELLEVDCYVETFQTHSNDIICVIGSKTPNYNIHKTLKTLAGYLNEFFSLSVFSCFSSEVSSVYQLHNAYCEVQLLKKYYPIFGPSSIITMADIAENQQNTQTQLSDTLIQQVVASVWDKNASLTNELMHQLCQSCKCISVENLDTCTYQFLRQLNRNLRENRVINTMMENGRLSEIQVQLSEFPTVEAYFTGITHCLVNVTMQIDLSAEAKNQRFLDQLYEYVDQNYQDCNLTSQSIADYLGYSSKHVMKKFKDLTGDSLVNYILHVRMEHAAQLLLNATEPIYSVAQKVGIESNSYFYKLFKNTYGCTPKEYVNAIRANQTDKEVQ